MAVAARQSAPEPAGRARSAGRAARADVAAQEDSAPGVRAPAAQRPSRRRRRRSRRRRPSRYPTTAAAAADGAGPAPTESGRTPAAGERDAAAYVTPLVRKLAADHGIDLSTVTGTGIGGRIRKQDVLAAAEAAQGPRARARGRPGRPGPGGGEGPGRRAGGGAPKRGTTEKMSRLRKTIARRMVESLQVSAQLTTVVEVDVTRISRLRDRGQGRLRASARAPSSASCRSSRSPPSRPSRPTRRSTRASRTTR